MKTNKYKNLKKKLKRNRATKLHAIHDFRRDHLRSDLGIISGLGIICGRGSCCAVQTSVPVSHWNLKNLTTDTSLDHSRFFPPAQYFRMALLLLSQIKGHLYFLFE